MYMYLVLPVLRLSKVFGVEASKYQILGGILQVNQYMYTYLVLPVLRLSKVFGVEGEDWSQGEEMGLIKLPVNTKVLLGGKYLGVNTGW